MNKLGGEQALKSPIMGYLRGKWKDLMVIAFLIIGVLFAVSRVFKDDEPRSIATQMTETESKVSRLLQEIKGVGDAEVIVCETEGGEKSVVVVCDGANDIRVIMEVREAVAAALGTEEKFVKIYQKK